MVPAVARANHAYAFPCLYCGDIERPRTEEHVLQRAFGTTLVLEDDVCGDCNTRVFSPLDTKLVDFARRFGFCNHPDLPVKRTMIDGQLGVTFDQAAGLWKSVLLNKRVEPIVLPQFVPRDGTCEFFTDVRFFDDGHFEKILAELREPTTLTINTEVLPNKTPTMDTAIVRSAPRVYLVRAPDDASAEAMRKLVATGEFGARLTSPTAPRSPAPFQPRVEMNLTIPLGDIERAVAKAGMNFICRTLGPEAARGDGLQGLRDFARKSVRGTGKAGYVSLTILREPEPQLAALCSAFSFVGQHTMLLLPTGRGPHLIFLILYGRPFAVVFLSPSLTDAPLGPEPRMAAALFDYKARTHRVYSMPKDVEWFGERLALVQR